MLHGKMPGIAHNPSTRSVCKVVLCLRVAALALLGALVLAASAQAADGASVGGPGAAEAPSTSLAPEAGGTGASPEPLPEAETVGAPAPAPAEKAPEPVSATPAPEKAPETVSTPAPAESSETSAPVATEKQEVPVVPVVPVVPIKLEVPIVEKAPELPKVAEKAPELPKGGDGSERELVSVVAAPEKTSEDPPAPTILATPVALTRNDLGYATPEIGYEAAPDVPGALINSPTDPPTGGSLEVTAPEAAASAAAVRAITGAQRAGELNCALSSLGGDMTDSCTTEWLGAQRLLSGAPAGYAAAVAALAPPSNPPGNGGHGGTAVGSPPVSPGPGPAPSGASGSSAGATGLALSGFLTLGGLLLLGAPRAMRRLRLSCQPWRTACFVLIPERPG
jgi:hypothetical protein